MTLKIGSGIPSGMASFVGLGLLAAAVITELRKPASSRSWQGKLGDMVPYDRRPPSIARIRQRLWSHDDPRVIVPSPFGVGWSVNFAALLKAVA